MLSHFICSSLVLFLSDCFIISLIQISGIFFKFVSRHFILYCCTEMGIFLSHQTSNWVSFYKILLVPATLLGFLIMCSSFSIDSFQFSRLYHMQIVFPLSFQFLFFQMLSLINCISSKTILNRRRDSVVLSLNLAGKLSVFPHSGGTLVKNPPANVGDTRDVGSVPGSGRSPGVGNGKPLQYSCLENSMDRRTWWTIVHGVSRVGHD